MDQSGRDLMKSMFAETTGFVSDQTQGKPNPLLQVEPREGSEILDLPQPDDNVITERDVVRLVNERRSRRKYADKSLTMAELAWLLWASAGVKRVVGDGYVTMRTVPSAGGRHPFETYLVVRAVEELECGVYHYLPLSHQLEKISAGDEHLPKKAAMASAGQAFVADAAVTFAWAAVPYRCEWRYGPVSYKAMLLDAGHIAQNLYLAVESIGAGCCAIAAYSQEMWDKLLGLDGKDEFTVYLAAVGKGK
jgi:SagB-type dehydrogenase family enzyme